MAKIMSLLTCALGLLFAIFMAWYTWTDISALLSICITLGVFTYHFVMRLIVGFTIHIIFRNRINYRRRWFRPMKFEKKLYAFLKVRRWKKYVPTYSPDTYSPKKHSWEEIAMATCQSEIVHEIIIVLSFLPLILIIPFGDPLVFVLTSVGAAMIDSIFVILQRYNRPQIVSVVERQKNK